MPSQVPATKPQPVLIIGTITTVIMAIGGGLATIAGLNDQPVVSIVAGVLTLVGGAVNQGLAYYVRGQVIPSQDVTEYINDQRELVPGPAA